MEKKIFTLFIQSSKKMLNMEIQLLRIKSHLEGLGSCIKSTPLALKTLTLTLTLSRFE